MGTLVEGALNLKNGVLGYEADYQVSASYSDSGSFINLVDGGDGYIGKITVKVKSTNSNWHKDVRIKLKYGGSNTIVEKTISIPSQSIFYSTSFTMKESSIDYGPISLSIQNINSGDETTLIRFGSSSVSAVFSGDAKYLTNSGFCGVATRNPVITQTLNNSGFSLEGEGGFSGTKIRFYSKRVRPTITLKIEHGDDGRYAAVDQGYQIAYKNYSADGAPQGSSWTLTSGTYSLNKKTYTETITYQIPDFSTYSNFLNYPIRKYGFYYNNLLSEWAFSPIDFSFSQIIENEKDIQIDFGTTNKYLLQFYPENCLELRAKEGTKNQSGSVSLKNGRLIGLIEDWPNDEDVSSKQITFSVFNNDIEFFTADLLVYFKIAIEEKGYTYTKYINPINNTTGNRIKITSQASAFNSIQYMEEIDISASFSIKADSTWIQMNKENFSAKLFCNDELIPIIEEYDFINISNASTSNVTVTFKGVTINNLQYINVDNANQIKLIVRYLGKELILGLSDNMKAYDITKSLEISNNIKYILVQGNEINEGTCTIASGELIFNILNGTVGTPLNRITIEVSRDGVSQTLTFQTNTSSKNISGNNLKKLLYDNNDMSDSIKINPMKKKDIPIYYKISYYYTGSSTKREVFSKELIFTVPPLATPTIAYRREHVGINCEPGDEAVLDIRIPTNNSRYKYVNFQNKNGTSTGFIDIEKGMLSISEIGIGDTSILSLSGGKVQLNNVEIPDYQIKGNYLTIDIAESTYQKKPSGDDSFVLNSTLTSNYLTKSSLESTYLSKDQASSTYLTSNNASSTYQKKIEIYTQDISHSMGWNGRLLDESVQITSDFSGGEGVMATIELDNDNGKDGCAFGNIKSVSKNGTTITVNYEVSNTRSAANALVTGRIKVLDIRN